MYQQQNISDHNGVWHNIISTLLLLFIYNMYINMFSSLLIKCQAVKEI